LNGTGRQWIPKRDFLAGFLGISSDFADAVDVRGRLRTLLDGGPWSIQAVPPIYIRIKVK
jgi:hypothetical protein